MAWYIKHHNPGVSDLAWYIKHHSQGVSYMAWYIKHHSPGVSDLAWHIKHQRKVSINRFRQFVVAHSPVALVGIIKIVEFLHHVCAFPMASTYQQKSVVTVHQRSIPVESKRRKGIKHIQHSVELENTAILTTESRWFERGVKEAIYITALNTSLNRDGGRYILQLPPVWDIIIKKKRHVQYNTRKSNCET